MKFHGHLHKMRVELASPTRYWLDMEEGPIGLHDLLGRQLDLKWLGEIHCIHCGRATRKSFNQGYCYPCFRTLARCDICIVSPEKCHYDAGTCREPEWGEQHCLQPHLMYLSNTSGVKVGITRQTQVPTRWIDQGARQALPIARVPTRHDAGSLEVAFKQYLDDRTNWRGMLKDDYQPADLPRIAAETWQRVEPGLDEDLRQRLEWLAEKSAPQDIDYPAQAFPQKIASFNLDKTPRVGGRLSAVKGQYLIFESGVINLRKYAGYRVEIELED